MRYATKHADWTGYLTREEFASYEKELGLREWCRERMKDHEAAIVRLQMIASERKAAVKEAAE